jgi:multidrug efflux pump
VEFYLDRDLEAAVNDIRDRVSRILDNLPDEADPPEIFKVDSNSSVIIWLNLVSNRMDGVELTDYAERYLVDRFSVLDGVARVFVGGARRYAMRIWLDRPNVTWWTDFPCWMASLGSLSAALAATPCGSGSTDRPWQPRT